MRRQIHKIDKGYALCGAKERTLNYHYLLYTESDDDVTCPKCKKITNKGEKER